MKRRSLKNNAYTIIVLLPVYIIYFKINQDYIFEDIVDGNFQHLTADCDVLLTATIEGKEQNILVLHSVLKRYLQRWSRNILVLLSIGHFS